MAEQQLNEIQQKLFKLYSSTAPAAKHNALRITQELITLAQSKDVSRLKEKIAMCDEKQDVTNILFHHVLLLSVAEAAVNKHAYTGFLDEFEQIVTKEVKDKLSTGFDMCFVFTAHPTETQRQSFLPVLESILDNIDCPEKSVDAMKSLWLIPPVRSNKPTVLDEVLWCLEFARTSIWPALFKLQDEFKQRFDIKLPVSLGRWMGGDRDGNPFVDAEVLFESCRMSELALLDMFKDNEQISSRIKILKHCQYPNYPAAMDMSSVEMALRVRLAKSQLRVDLRQTSKMHRKLLQAMFPDLQLTEQALVAFLHNKANVPAQLEDAELIKEWQIFCLAARLPSYLKGCYIISMCHNVCDLLILHALMHTADIDDLPVVPLFETLEDLNRAPAIIQAYLQIGLPIKSLQVMLGYSDSAKDAGVFAANWAIWKATNNISTIARTHKVKLRFFHGRGGSSSRGGMRAINAIMSAPAGSFDGGFRLTQQGEVMRHKWGRVDDSLTVISRHMLAIAKAWQNNDGLPDEQMCKLMDKWASASAEHYQRVTRSDEFFDYMNKATPLQYLAELNIGSRPTHRSAKTSLEELRAIPWVFAWSQHRLMLTAWCGLAVVIENMTQAEFDHMMRWPFFKALIGLIEMSMSKACLDVAASYDAAGFDGVPPNIAAQLRDEFNRTTARLCELRGHDDLLSYAPKLKSQIKAREHYLLVLGLIGADAMKNGDKDVLLSAITASASGLKNAG